MAEAITSTLGTGVPLPSSAVPVPQTAVLDMFIPGFSVFSEAIQRYLHIDLNLYIPMVLVAGSVIFCWSYVSETFWGLIQSYCMSSVDIRTDDELYNYIMAWVAGQNFSKDSRRSIANTNLNSRSWFLFRWDRDEDEDDGEGGVKKKALAYTPTFGSHYFWYRGRLLIFRRNQNRDQASFLAVSEREEVSLSCFGRNPWVLKELLNEAREVYVKKDESKTVIYRGSMKGTSGEPSWQRCMARTSRPFSTVILNEKVKKDLIDDVTDYLNPATRRWYSNRGIPYRRGYLLHGPPGTGKSSLSLALAGFFKMRIYIVSLSSVTANEENLSSLFAELPRRCVVLLEDIDTAGLTHTREGQEPATDDEVAEDAAPKKKKKGGSGSAPGAAGTGTSPLGRLSLSGLLNILDGVASQEGRVLIMTTNHIDKLDKALIRPGRVDMIVKFDRSDRGMTAAIFRAIYAPLEGDVVASAADLNVKTTSPKALFNFRSSSAAAAEVVEKEKKEAEEKKREEEEAKEKKENLARVEALAEEFADRIPSHEFSPAEIQGYLLKNKRDPAKAVDGAAAWVVETRREKKEKELKEAEAKRKEEEEKKKKEAQEEEERKKKEDKKKKKGGSDKAAEGKGKGKKGKKSGSKDSEQESGSESGSGSGSDSGEGSESSESEEETKSSKTKKSKAKVPLEPEKEEVAEDSVGKEVPAEPVAGEPAKKESSAAGVEDKLLAEEKKHGGDSGYGTP
jgi:chaperone BCS1